MPKDANRFKYPLRSRVDMADYILKVGGNFCYQNRKYYPLAWNVKTGGAKQDIEHFIKIHDTFNHLNPTQLAKLRELYTEEYGEAYSNNTDAQNSAGTSLFYRALELAADSLRDGDAYSQLRDGTEVGAKWIFTGRSGGYATLTEFMGIDLVRHGTSEEAFSNFLKTKEYNRYGEPDFWEIEYKELRLLYKFCVEMNEFLTMKAAREEVEYQMAFLVFSEFEDELKDYADEKILLSTYQ